MGRWEYANISRQFCANTAVVPGRKWGGGKSQSFRGLDTVLRR